MFFSYFQNIQGILFLDLHHGSSELDSFVKVLENLLFYEFHFLFLVDSSTKIA